MAHPEARQRISFVSIRPQMFIETASLLPPPLTPTSSVWNGRTDWQHTDNFLHCGLRPISSTMDKFSSNNQPSSPQASQKEKNCSPRRKFTIVDNETAPTLINEQSTNPNHQLFENSNTDKQSLSSRASEFLSQDSQFVTVNMSKNELDPLTMPFEERQKLERAKRNREAAYRSRAKNKIRQCAVEEDTRKNLALNTQLRSMLEFLLTRLRSPSSMDGTAQQHKQGKNS